MTQVAAVLILAAGAGRRFGGCKQLAKIGGETILGRMCKVGMELAPSTTYVVVGYQAQNISAQLPSGAVPVFNNNWECGLGCSIAEGIRALSEDCEMVLILLADQILVSAEMLRVLLSKFHAETDKIICSGYNGTMGVPAIFPRSFFVKLMSLHGDSGAKEMLKQYSRQCKIVAMPEAGIDIDTLESLRQYKLRQYNKLISSKQ